MRRGPSDLEYVGVGVIEVCACSANAIRGLGLLAAHFCGTCGRGFSRHSCDAFCSKEGWCYPANKQLAGTTTPCLSLLLRLLRPVPLSLRYRLWSVTPAAATLVGAGPAALLVLCSTASHQSLEVAVTASCDNSQQRGRRQRNPKDDRPPVPCADSGSIRWACRVAGAGCVVLAVWGCVCPRLPHLLSLAPAVCLRVCAHCWRR